MATTSLEKTRMIRIHGIAAALAALVTWASPAHAHDFRLGPLRIDHPYATPTPPGASTPAARAVEIHRSVIDAQNVMRMRAIDGIPLPPKAELQLRHGGEHHLMLIGLKKPLKVGETAPVTLKFEKAGSVTVPFDVRAGGPAPMGMKHH